MIRYEGELPNNLKLCFTEVSDGNMAIHTAADPHLALANRAAVIEPAFPELQWLNQVHSTKVIRASDLSSVPTADASYSRGEVSLAVLTADCLPVCFFDEAGDEIAVAHAGWRGLMDGILSKTLEYFQSTKVTAVIGPSISQSAYQVDRAFREGFIDRWGEASKMGFRADGPDHFRADLKALARLHLQQHGCDKVIDTQLCTYLDQRFFSYRRDKTSGRIATIIGPSI